MSYILDALRKADSERERERGAVPDLHAQPLRSSAVADDDEPARRLPPLVGAVIGLSVAVLALLAWLFFGRDAAVPNPSPQAVAPQPAPPLSLQMPQVQPMPPAALQTPPAAPPNQQPAPPAPPSLPPPTARIDPPPAPVQALAQPRVPQPSPAPALQSAAPQPAAPQPPAPQQARADNRVWALDELPDDVRRQLPNLAVNGSKYSDAPASRILIVNGLVFHEGDRLTPELTLEQIKVKEAVLRFRGYRYTLKF
jgi:general secretion pathway protein B